MKTLRLTSADIKIQYKYGFYLLYSFFTLFYVFILNIMPASWQKTTAVIMIYSDPAAMGLFFMGAIVLLEKSQMILNSLAVSPIKISQYINAKVLSLGLIGTIVGVIIALSAQSNNIITVIIAVFLSSVVFSLIGLIVAFKASSLNQFVIATVPFELILTAPPVITLFGYDNPWLILLPGVAAIKLLSGSYTNPFLLILIQLFWITVSYFICIKVVKKTFRQLGGCKV
ncbi:MAG: hypothetical protein A2Y17_02450 [Clostridiales bacterium GWF2_38_85]|nr:MAG: hypothetical protein A2Y17_02450 [Clostridiales bacterium GWF2_38_85]HBL85059.1 ABC transporter permease [Clostridiales bacterium]